MPHTSRGTVRFESVMDRTLIFVPDSDHFHKRGNRECAVFYNDNHAGQDRFIDLDANRRGVEVTFDTVLQGADTEIAIHEIAIQQLLLSALAMQLLSSAVTRQTKVGIKVAIAEHNNDVKLIDIALPAP